MTGLATRNVLGQLLSIGMGSAGSHWHPVVVRLGPGVDNEGANWRELLMTRETLSVLSLGEIYRFVCNGKTVIRVESLMSWERAAK